MNLDARFWSASFASSTRELSARVMADAAARKDYGPLSSYIAYTSNISLTYLHEAFELQNPQVMAAIAAHPCCTSELLYRIVIWNDCRFEQVELALLNREDLPPQIVEALTATRFVLTATRILEHGNMTAELSNKVFENHGSRALPGKHCLYRPVLFWADLSDFAQQRLAETARTSRDFALLLNVHRQSEFCQRALFCSLETISAASTPTSSTKMSHSATADLAGEVCDAVMVLMQLFSNTTDLAVRDEIAAAASTLLPTAVQALTARSSPEALALAAHSKALDNCIDAKIDLWQLTNPLSHVRQPNDSEHSVLVHREEYCALWVLLKKIPAANVARFAAHTIILPRDIDRYAISTDRQTELYLSAGLFDTETPEGTDRQVFLERCLLWLLNSSKSHDYKAEGWRLLLSEPSALQTFDKLPLSLLEEYSDVKQVSSYVASKFKEAQLSDDGWQVFDELFSPDVTLPYILETADAVISS